MPYSFNTFNSSCYFGLPPTLPAQITAAMAAGYDFVGLDLPSVTAHAAEGVDVHRIREHLDAAGIACYELVPLPLGLADDTAAAQLRQMVDTARALDAQHVLATTRIPQCARLVEQLRRAANTLAEIGVRLSVEFMATSPLQTLEQAMSLLAAAGAPEVGVVLDAWHLCLGDGNANALTDLASDLIGFVQLADAPRGACGDNLDDSLHRRLLPGQGELPLSDTCERIRQKGFSGVVSVEVLARSWRHMPIDAFAAATLQAAAVVWEGGRESSHISPSRQTATITSRQDEGTTL